MSGIKISGISKIYGTKKILHSLDLDISDGEFVSLIGASGCGKTSMLSIIAGLTEPSAGDIYFNDTLMNNIAVEKRGAVIVDQNIVLFPHMTVEDNINFGLRMIKMNKKEIKQKTTDLLKLIKLEEHGDKYPHEISGGQQQRVAIARALAIEPKVLLLDEPFSKLDVTLREEIRDFVKNIHRKMKITTIMVSHDIEETMVMSDKIAVMMDGKICQYGTPKEIYESPATAEIAVFLGHKNFITGSVEDGLFKTSLGNFKSNLNNSKKVTAMIQSNRVEITNDKYGKDVGVSSRIIDSCYNGGATHLTLDCQGISLKCITSEEVEQDDGQMINVFIDLSKAIYYTDQ